MVKFESYCLPGYKKPYYDTIKIRKNGRTEMDANGYRISENVVRLVPGYLPDAGRIQHFIRTSNQTLAEIGAPDYAIVCGDTQIRAALDASCSEARTELERYASDLGLVTDPDLSRFVAERPSDAPAEKGVCIPVMENSSRPDSPPLMICKGSKSWVMLAEPEGP